MNKVEFFIKSLKDNGLQVILMKHGYRVNGGIDIYKQGKTVFIKENNEYKKFDSVDEMQSFVLSIVNKIKRVDNFKKRKYGISYAEFKNNMWNDKDSSVAEDYQWNNDKNISEDHMYFIFQIDTVKIGRTKDIDTRIKELLTGLPYDPVVYLFSGKGHLEKNIHRVFDQFRINREWFLSDNRIKAFAYKYGKEHKIIKTKKSAKKASSVRA